MDVGFGYTDVMPTSTLSTQATTYDLSAVIVSYNSAHLLRTCLSALHQATGPFSLETIVVDNGSNDGSLEMLRGELKPTRLVEAGKNLGFSRANNLGVKYARGRYYLLLNTDCFLRPGALERLVTRLEAEPGVGVVGPRLLNADGSLQPSCHNFPGPLVFFLEQSSLWKLIRHVPLLRDKLFIASRHDRRAQVDWLVGACMLVRAEAIAQVGGFDERFFFYWEETDLCMRLRNHGWKTLFEPSAQAVHLGGGSSINPDLRVRFFRSLYRFYRKHYPPYRLAVAQALVRLMALYKAGRSWIASLSAGSAVDEKSHAIQDARGWLATARL
jgi:GT2 family glycosyltransferase